MTHQIEAHAAELLAVLEANPGLLMTYSEWADELGWSTATVQNTYRWLYHNTDNANLVIPAPYNSYVAGLQLVPGAETYDGIANQERHLRTRHTTQRHRVQLATASSVDRSDKKMLRSYGAGLDAMSALNEAMAGMLQAAAEKKRSTT